MRPLITLFSILLITSQAYSWQNEVNVGKPGPYRNKKGVELKYSLSWNGLLKSGEFKVKFEENKGKSKPVKITSTGNTTGFAYQVYPYSFSSESYYNGKTLRPISYYLWERNKDEVKSADGKFRKNRVKVKEFTKTHAGKEYTEKRTFSYKNLLDIYTSILYVGSLPLKNGDSVNVVMNPVFKPYYAKIKVLGREKHRGKQCIKLDLKLSKIDPDTLKLKSYKKVTSATMWITDDEQRIMTELRSKVFIGDVRATLKKTKLL